MRVARNAGSPPSVNYLIGKKINEEPAGETDPFFSTLGIVDERRTPLFVCRMREGEGSGFLR